MQVNGDNDSDDLEIDERDDTNIVVQSNNPEN